MLESWKHCDGGLILTLLNMHISIMTFVIIILIIDDDCDNKVVCLYCLQWNSSMFTSTSPLLLKSFD